MSAGMENSSLEMDWICDMTVFKEFEFVWDNDVSLGAWLALSNWDNCSPVETNRASISDVSFLETSSMW